MNQHEKNVLLMLCEKILSHTGTEEAILILKQRNENRIQIVLVPWELNDPVMIDIKDNITAIVNEHARKEGSTVSYMNRDGEAFEP